MRIPKCPKTASGKHDWIKEKLSIVSIKEAGGAVLFKDGKPTLTIPPGLVPSYGMVKITPICENCGMIDDRKRGEK
jgi:hypothetical protein